MQDLGLLNQCSSTTNIICLIVYRRKKGIATTYSSPRVYGEIAGKSMDKDFLPLKFCKSLKHMEFTEITLFRASVLIDLLASALDYMTTSGQEPLPTLRMARGCGGRARSASDSCWNFEFYTLWRAKLRKLFFVTEIFERISSLNELTLTTSPRSSVHGKQSLCLCVGELAQQNGWFRRLKCKSIEIS